MIWFDTKMGAEGTVQSADGAPVVSCRNSRGLSTFFDLFISLCNILFDRETDDIHTASSLASGILH
jgi:hypothetical protein